MEEATTPAPPNTAANSTRRSSRKTKVGEVISSGMNKTIVVRTVTRVPHSRFGKIVKQMKKVLRARRGKQGEDRRHGAHHGNASIE